MAFRVPFSSDHPMAFKMLNCSCIVELLAYCISFFPSYSVEVFSTCAVSTPELVCPLHTLAISRYVEQELFFISLFFCVSVLHAAAFHQISAGHSEDGSC